MPLIKDPLAPLHGALTAGPGSRPLARLGAVVSVGCALLHGLLLVGSPVGWLSVLHAGVALGCLPCAVHLWRRPGLPAWLAHGALALVMALGLPLAMAASGSGGHAHLTVPATGPAAGVEVAAPLLALLSLGIAALAVAGCWLRPQSSAAPGAEGDVRRVPQA